MRIRLKHHCLAKILARRPLSLNHWAQRLGINGGHLSGTGMPGAMGSQLTTRRKKCL